MFFAAAAAFTFSAAAFLRFPFRSVAASASSSASASAAASSSLSTTAPDERRFRIRPCAACGGGDDSGGRMVSSNTALALVVLAGRRTECLCSPTAALLLIALLELHGCKPALAATLRRWRSAGVAILAPPGQSGPIGAEESGCSSRRRGRCADVGREGGGGE
ncbi:uncharacterized protein LAJ45_05643 [Morchella importuna]|uniref:uncharacterized protein n=1 Tax=Morchella importuna TaxID=1174673 RepID=UPI001E8D9EC8|nr:uncharacterized protein LAJ45_05643 [Morchella importuna]KAH8150431.1 hypothetical protein LAJ45_05643 [Morchella importuna]